MTANKTTERVIGLWLDTTSEPGKSSWIVSRDRMNSRGEAVHSETVTGPDVDDNDDAYGDARDEAIELARKEGLCVIETSGRGQQETIYAPKIVTLSDVGCMAKYRLSGDYMTGHRWEMIDSGGNRDALNENGCEVDDDASDDDIIDAVRESWTGDGYDGDPDENGLTITVEAEKSIID